MNRLHNRDFFYKYTTVNVAKKILNDLQVKYSSPLLFNDPFDSQIEIQHDVTSSEELMKRATGKICELMKPFLKDGNVKQAHESTFNEIMTDPKFVNDRQVAFKRFYVEINEKVLEFAKEDRIFCVSETKDNLLMWAHYTSEYRGAVIQFKCIPGRDTALCAAKPVIYSDKMPLLTIEDFFKGRQAIEEYILNGMLLTKSQDWEHEREWRIILKGQNINQDYDLRGILENEIYAVFLGCRMDKNDKNEIIDIVKKKRKNIKIYDSFKNRQKFKLDFKELMLKG